MNAFKNIGLPLLSCAFFLPQIGVTIYLAWKAKQARFHSPLLAQNLWLAALLAGVGIVFPLLTAIALVVVVRGRERTNTSSAASVQQGTRPPTTWSGFS
jgi:TRAP-type mannitol/chloroaromatic compound transport system permease small subunit